MARAAAVIDIFGQDSIKTILPEFKTALDRKSPRTVQSYEESVLQLDEFLEQTGRSRVLAEITCHDINAWTAALRKQVPPRRPGSKGYSQATVALRYRSVGAFFSWCVKTGELQETPLKGSDVPKVDEVPVDFVTEAEFSKLIKAIESGPKTFETYRDAALLRLLYDSGARLSELTTLRLPNDDEPDERRPGSGMLYLAENIIEMYGKGRRYRRMTFGAKARGALRHYLAARNQHPLSESEWLWLGSRGMQLTPSGISQLLERRCEQAGIRKLHPHLFRHARADHAKRSGLRDDDIMTLMGWRNREMLRRYGSAAEQDRALDAARDAGAPGDRL